MTNAPRHSKNRAAIAGVGMLGNFCIAALCGRSSAATGERFTNRICVSFIATAATGFILCRWTAASGANGAANAASQNRSF